MSANLQFRLFLVGLQEKIKNNDLLHYRFGDRVMHIDDEDDPDFRGFKTSDPLLGFKMLEIPVGDEETLESGQYEINIQVRFSVFLNRRYKDPFQENLVGTDALVALWELALNELAAKLDRNNFYGTSYPGEITEVYLRSIGGPTRLRSPAHPDLMRMDFTLEYQTVMEVEI